MKLPSRKFLHLAADAAAVPAVSRVAMPRHAWNLAVLSSLAAFSLTYSTAVAQENAITPALIQKSVQANVQEFFDLLALPNDSINAGDIGKNAD
jgi:hypothetical protein